MLTSLEARIKPVNGRILCKLSEREERKMGDIVLPQLNSSASSRLAKVISIASNVSDDVKRNIKVGNIVLLSEFGGEKFNINNCEYRMMKADDVLGVIKQ